MYQSVPAAAAMNRVPGFDPFKFLRLAVSEETQEKVWKLDLRYMKVWFRMARPNGRMKLKSLRITEQLAIFEAQVYMDRSDAEPFSNYIAQCTAEEAKSGDYIREAQDAALTVALDNAGFGIQFADLTGLGIEERYGSERSVSKNQDTKSAVSQTVSAQMSTQAQQGTMQLNRPVSQAAPVQRTVQPTAQPAPQTAPMQSTEQRKPQPVTQAAAPQKAEQPKSQPVTQAAVPQRAEQPRLQPVTQAAVQRAIQPKVQSVPQTSAVRNVTQIQQTVAATVQQSAKEHLPVMSEQMHLPVEESQAPAVVQCSEESLPVAEENVPTEENTLETESRYTQSMSVEEILSHMTFEEAQKVVVDVGVCKDWTMAEVADRRPPSLKYYVYGGYKGDNNIIRAAAKIMLDSLEARKAG